MKRLGRFLFKRLGWKHDPFPQLDKCVAIGAPHTSNWDLLFSLLYAWTTGMKPEFLIKKELFRFPFGWLMRWVGGIPVDRNSKSSFVEQAAEWFQKRDFMQMVISPEGTRRRQSEWKSGFYHIARLAGVPIVAVYMDYTRKYVGIGGVFQPTGDYEKDLAAIQAVYKNVMGKHPQNYGQGEAGQDTQS